MITIVRTEVDQRKLNEEPQAGQTQECREWKCRGRGLCPAEEVEHEDEAEHQTREEQRSLGDQVS